MAESENPLLAALPPNSDYLTYLTIIEYNLKREDLPLLNDILQDKDLTINIGWDLVILLLPLLPASETCLQTIARLGNPREVLLKVTEALRCIDFVEEGQEPKDAVQDDGSDFTQGQVAKERNDATPQDQFCVLISMLLTLHRRIKTKYPSRFIATTLQGALAAFSQAQQGHEVMIKAVDGFMRGIWRQGRPDLPPRDSGGSISKAPEQSSGDDPEAQPDPPAQSEHQIIVRLLQSFVTHVTEAYVNATSSTGEVPGLGWSSKIFEKTSPSMMIPGRSSMKERFETESYLAARRLCMDVLAKLAEDLGLSTDVLFKSSLEAHTAIFNSTGDEEDPPSSTDDIPLSQTGSLYLLTGEILATKFNNTGDNLSVDATIFPNQLNMVQNFIGTEDAGGLNTAGSEPLALIDAVLALGIAAVDASWIGKPESDEEFTQYLQVLTLLSANTPDSSLRFHAHFLASTVLRTHPSDVVRLAFIRDTLEHCPIENLKASAVAWIKGETLEAALAADDKKETVFESDSIFATPVALESLAPFLFPDITQEVGFAGIEEKWEVFKANLSFYLASLNFYYLLLSATSLHETLDISSLHSNNDIGGSMLGPLRELSAEFSRSLNNGELAVIEGSQGIQIAKGDLAVLNDVLTRVEGGVIQLNKSPA